MLFFSHCVQAAPTISSVFPDGTHQFQASTKLSFTASSTAGVTNVTVALTITSLKGTSFIRNLSSASGLTITGPATGESVSAALSSNTLYIAAVQVTDATGATVSTNITFDTIAPVYTWEAEDWDFTSNGVPNLFIDNPQTNAYAGLATTVEGTGNNGPGAYRPATNAAGTVVYPSTEGASDIPRLQFMGTGKSDYDVGWTAPGLFGNYTRNYPAGNYNLYARAAGGNGPKAQSGIVSVSSGAATISGSGPYKFGVKGRGWQNYDFMPVTDSTGTMIEIAFDGNPNTLQVAQGSDASDNMNFFMLMQADTNPPVAGPTYTNLYPDGTVQFQPADAFTFTAISGPGVSPSDIFVQLTATNLLGLGFVKQYTTANGLIVSGPSTNLSVSVPLTKNTIYTAFIQAIDQNGNAGTTGANPLAFDTINPVYTWEAEDFNYGGGNFYDNPQTNAYALLDGTPGVDYNVDNPLSGSHSYRNNPNINNGIGGPATEGSGDIPRVAYTTSGLPDYDIGFNDPANWENYTRNFPTTGTFNIFLRGANGGGGVGNLSMARVTSTVTDSNQTVANLGSFAIPSTGNWQKYLFAALKDINGNLVQITFSGSGPQTLRAFSPSSCNAQFYMLIAADTSLPVVTGLYPDGTGLFQRTNTLSFTATALDGISTSNIIVTLNGVALTNLSFSGSSTSRKVSYSGLQPDQTYTASISVKSLTGGTYTKSITFDTYSENNYTLEASDFDYTSNGVSALFFDNPQTNAYNGLPAAIGIDELEVTGGTPQSEDLYRTNAADGTLLVTTQPGGDLFRKKFATLPSWRINWFGFGDFVNYTRHYPAGTYKVVGRFTEGGLDSSARLLKVTAGVGTSTQTTTTLGSFTIPANGWNGWEFATLVDGSGNPVSVTLDGSQTTLQLAGPAVDDTQTINAGFFMFIPVVAPGLTLTASLSGGQIKIAFPTTTGSSYQVEYKNDLKDASWTSLGSPLVGNNAVQFVQDPTTGSRRFYRVQIQ
jgi:hypothetical protein